MSDLKKQIIELIMTVCQTSKPDLSDLDRPLLESGLDSLDYVSVLMAIEDKYECENRGLSFYAIDLEEIQTGNAIIALLESHNVTG